MREKIKMMLTSFLICMAMGFVLLPGVKVKAGNVVSVTTTAGESEFATLQAAFDAVAQDYNGKVKLLQDIAVEGTVTLKSDIQLDLNGHTFNVTGTLDVPS